MHWSLEQRGRVAVLTFTRPPQNWMNLASMTELQRHLEALGGATGEVSVVLLTGGVDGYFIAHADMDDLALVARGEVPEGDIGAWNRCCELLESMAQPTVAAIDGQAWGGGLEVALACTMRVGSSRAHVGLPEVSVGLIPGAGGTQRLPRLIGTAKSAELIIGARVIGAEEALALGVLNAVLPADGFVDAAVHWCGRFARQPPAAVFAAKRAILAGRDRSVAEGLAVEAQLFADLNRSDDARSRNVAVERPNEHEHLRH